MSVIIRPARAADLDTAICLLRNAGLPVEDLSFEQLALSAERDGNVQGVIGLQSFGNAGLLRSLVVSNDVRGAGIGRQLVAALESDCIANGMTELWLLTIDADTFFAQLGYRVRQRHEAPDVIRGTAEFSGLCPDDAVLMSKPLGPIAIP